jgi:uncharacterized protein YggL (DUF469 family)
MESHIQSCMKRLMEREMKRYISNHLKLKKVTFNFAQQLAFSVEWGFHDARRWLAQWLLNLILQVYARCCLNHHLFFR